MDDFKKAMDELFSSVLQRDSLQVALDCSKKATLEFMKQDVETISKECEHTKVCFEVIGGAETDSLKTEFNGGGNDQAAMTFYAFRSLFDNASNENKKMNNLRDAVALYTGIELFLEAHRKEINALFKNLERKYAESN